MTEECFRISVDVCSLMEPPGTTNQLRSFGLPPCMWTSRLPVRIRAMARLNERFCSPAGFVRMGLPNSLLMAHLKMESRRAYLSTPEILVAQSVLHPAYESECSRPSLRAFVS